MGKKERKQRPYIDVNIPAKLKPYLEEAIKNPRIAKELEIGRFSKTFSGLGYYIIREFLIENTSFRFQHLNTHHNRITIIDNKIRRVVDVYPKEQEQELWCGYCDSTSCEHTAFTLSIPAIRKVLEKKGWKLPEPKE